MKKYLGVIVIAIIVISNLYLVIDTVITNRTTRTLNQQMSEVNQQWSDVINQFQKQLDSRE